MELAQEVRKYKQYFDFEARSSIITLEAEIGEGPLDAEADPPPGPLLLPDLVQEERQCAIIIQLISNEKS